jgi:hypothetical protein
LKNDYSKIFGEHQWSCHAGLWFGGFQFSRGPSRQSQFQSGGDLDEFEHLCTSHDCPGCHGISAISQEEEKCSSRSVQQNSRKNRQPDFNAWPHDELLRQFPTCTLCDERRSFVVIAPKGQPPEARCFECDVAMRA